MERNDADTLEHDDSGHAVVRCFHCVRSFGLLGSPNRCCSLLTLIAYVLLPVTRYSWARALRGGARGRQDHGSILSPGRRGQGGFGESKGWGTSRSLSEDFPKILIYPRQKIFWYFFIPAYLPTPRSRFPTPPQFPPENLASHCAIRSRTIPS
jgi:hypothetical protein